MPVPRCPALRRDGQKCTALAATPTAVFCRRHEQLAAVHGEEALRAGGYGRRRRKARDETPLVTEAIAAASRGNANGAAISPNEIRPRLAAMTAESVSEIQEALLDAALGATREHWTTFTCPDCSKKHRAQVQVPDVRARVGAIEVLLREGLGRPAIAEEPPTPRMPANVAAVRAIGWDELQALFAATYVDEIAAVKRKGGKALVREKIAALSAGERRALREALAEAPA
jgi:hypothetical protein